MGTYAKTIPVPSSTSQGVSRCQCRRLIERPVPVLLNRSGGSVREFLTWIPDCLQSWGCRPASRGRPAEEVVCGSCGGGRQATESSSSGWTGWSDGTHMTHELLELVREDWIYDECMYWLVVLSYCSTILPKNLSSKVLANPKRGVWLWLVKNIGWARVSVWE